MPIIRAELFTGEQFYRLQTLIEEATTVAELREALAELVTVLNRIAYLGEPDE